MPHLSSQMNPIHCKTAKTKDPEQSYMTGEHTLIHDKVLNSLTESDVLNKGTHSSAFLPSLV